jgi:hypothetical protein
MNNLIIERSVETPEINFNFQTGVLRVAGRAYSGDITKYYKQMSAWLEEYLKEPQDTTTIELQLDYYNSVFIKLLFYFFDRSKEVLQKNKKLTIKWFHQKDDEESIEDALRISKIINFPVETVELDE